MFQSGVHPGIVTQQNGCIRIAMNRNSGVKQP
jgi:hypothetical protein